MNSSRAVEMGEGYFVLQLISLPLVFKLLKKKDKHLDFNLFFLFLSLLDFYAKWVHYLAKTPVYMGHLCLGPIQMPKILLFPTLGLMLLRLQHRQHMGLILLLLQHLPCWMEKMFPEIYAITFDDAVAKEQETNPSASGHTVSVSALNDLFTQVSLPQSTRTKICSLINVPLTTQTLLLKPPMQLIEGLGTWPLLWLVFHKRVPLMKHCLYHWLIFQEILFLIFLLPNTNLNFAMMIAHCLTETFLPLFWFSFCVVKFPNTAITSDLSGGGPDAPNGSLAGPVWKSSVDASNYNPLSPNTISVALVPKREGTLFFAMSTTLLKVFCLPLCSTRRPLKAVKLTPAPPVHPASKSFDDTLILTGCWMLYKKYPFRLLPTLPPKKSLVW